MLSACPLEAQADKPCGCATHSPGARKCLKRSLARAGPQDEASLRQGLQRQADVDPPLVPQVTARQVQAGEGALPLQRQGDVPRDPSAKISVLESSNN